MCYGVYKQPILNNWRVGDLSLLAEKRDAVLDKLLLQNECRGHAPTTIAWVAQFHANANVELYEALDFVDIPGVEIYVVDGRGYD